MNDPTGFWRTGPTKGIAATVAAVGMAVLFLAYKAIPVFRGWGQAIFEVRDHLAEHAQEIARARTEVQEVRARIAQVEVEDRQKRLEVADKVLGAIAELRTDLTELVELARRIRAEIDGLDPEDEDPDSTPSPPPPDLR